MHLSRRFGRWALVLVASALAAPPLAAQLLPRKELEPSPEVRSVDFDGVTKAVDIDELRASIETDPTRCRSFFLNLVCKFAHYRGFEERHYLNRQEFKRDVIRIRVFYFKHGYRDAEVDTAITRLNEKQVAVRFTVREGPPTIVSSLSVTYDSTLFTDKKMRQLTLQQVGQPLDNFVIDSTRVNYQNALWELGYADALVDTSTVVDPTAHTARVQFRLVQNHLTTFGAIEVTGTEEVSKKTVLNSLGFREGDLFRRSTMIESQRNLYESNLFKLAAVEVAPSFDSVKDVNVVLREAQLHEARIGGGFNTVDYFQTEGRFTHHNLLGGARRLDVSATLGNLGANALNGSGIFHQISADSGITGDAEDFLKPTWSTSIELRQPAWLQRPRNALAIGGFAQRRSVPSVVIDRGYGGDLTYTRTLAARAPASLSYHFEVTRVEAGGPYFCVNFGVCENTTINVLRSYQRLSPVSAQVQVDRSDQPLAPTRGYIARATLEHASAATVSDYRYNRGYAEGALYSRLGAKDAVLATHLRLGFVRALGGSQNLGNPILHPRKRFYAGGSQSVRGYGENQLGPRILTLPSEFLRHSKTAAGTPCDAFTEDIRFCDPNFITDSLGKPVGDDKFDPRALGGTSLIEASVEYRFPLPFMKNLGGAVFIDGAAVGENALDPIGGSVQTLANLVRGAGAITPGFGVRYYSSVGPIRVDLGFNPSVAEDLAVVTDIIRNGRSELIPLEIPKRQFSPMGSGGGIGGWLNRFTLHLSIGQAY